MARKIVITSGKGGVGKTTITANLGLMLSVKGFRVCLVDLDFGLNNVDITLGLENRVSYDIEDVIEGRCRIKQALVNDNKNKNLYILPSGNTRNINNISGQQIKLVIENLSPLFDYVLIDCPAGIDIGFHRAVSCCDEALVIVTPYLTSIKDAEKLLQVIKTYKLNSVDLIINRVRGDLVASEKMLAPYEIESLLKTNLIGVLPEDDAVFLSVGMLSSSSESGKAYKILSKNLEKRTRKIYDTTNKYTGFFGSIRRCIKRGI
ncbi:MAG: septum site-determining protein MinD [Clostridia bacterium]|nr:septum site-determining protein MinD [Clostridia bacterium]